MNAVEIEEAISALAEQPFDGVEFPFAFLLAFGNKETTIKRLRAGASNKSDLGGVLQTNNIHIAVRARGGPSKMLNALKASPATAKAKARFILATDGTDFEAEDLETGETVACAYADFSDHFGFFLPLAGITTVKQVSESSFDIRATSRMNRLYVELLKDNPDWDKPERRHDMNHFMARLIFCFFAERTDIFHGTGLFTQTIERMSAKDSSNTHEVIAELFRAMDTEREHRKSEGIHRWADAFPYVNGELFSGSIATPRFSRIARSYLLHIGSLDWTKINPDIFGSMIQAVTEDEERGALGMHYTSVPNILKVLNPLFLDDLRARLEEADDNLRKLLNLRNRMAKIRVFDPACGSGNFLVIAYKGMREIEAKINKRRGEADRRTEIPLTNFRGIELRDFPAEVARLALIIAEFQCDVLYRGQKEALQDFLPLDAQNWITRGNALRLDWLSICPPTGTSVRLHGDDLFSTPLDQAQIDFENEGGETYICGNPPYSGNKLQTDDQKADLATVFASRTNKWKSLDYVAGWFMKAADFGARTKSASAFVSTNSICQGQQVSVLWPLIFASGHRINFAYASFKWRNLASSNAVVTVAIVSISTNAPRKRVLYSVSEEGHLVSRETENINAYLAPAKDVVVEGSASPINGLPKMVFGNMPRDNGHLLLDVEESRKAKQADPQIARFLKNFVGSEDAIHGKHRICVWVVAKEYAAAIQIPLLKARFEALARERRNMKAVSTQSFASKGAIDYILQTPKMKSIDVAAAYITCGGIDILSKTLDYRLVGVKVDKRWITSFDYCRTEPAALEAILSMPFSSVRIHDANFCLTHHGAPRVPFHPKTFLFRSATAEFGLAGSGNVSRSGLSKGHEAGLVVGVSRPPTTAEASGHSALKKLRGWFAATWNTATPLNATLLTRYRSLYESVDKLKNPTPTEDDVAAPDSAHGALTEKDLRKLRACGNFWIEAGNITKNRGPHLPGNQLMMKRMSRVFFGFEPKQVPENSFIGSVTIQYGGGSSLSYSLTYSDNKMDKLVLPKPGSDGPATYDNLLLKFTRWKPRQFRLSVGSAADKALWQKKSKAIDGSFSMNSGRQWGVF